MNLPKSVKLLYIIGSGIVIRCKLVLLVDFLCLSFLSVNVLSAYASPKELLHGEPNLIDKISKDDFDFLSDNNYIISTDPIENGEVKEFFIDFAADCGFSSNFEGKTYNIDNINRLHNRIQDYPKILKYYDKFTNSQKENISILKGAYFKAIAIARSSSDDLKLEADLAPIFKSAEKISIRIALKARIVYEGGCGAGEEDSQEINFVFQEKPKSAHFILDYDFKNCQYILNDEFNVEQCDNWISIKENETYYLSGKYKMMIIWDDGERNVTQISALGIGKKEIRIGH